MGSTVTKSYLSVSFEPFLELSDECHVNPQKIIFAFVLQSVTETLSGSTEVDGVLVVEMGSLLVSIFLEQDFKRIFIKSNITLAAHFLLPLKRMDSS